MSLRSLLRSVVEWIRPPRRVEPELRITPEQLRAALSEMLADPQTRRLVLRHFVGTVLPISGGVCTTNPAGIYPGAFGSDSECSTTTEFSFPRRLGIGTTAPAQRLEVFENDPSLNAVVRVRGSNQTGVFLDLYSGTAGQGLFAYGSQPLIFGVDGAERARIGLTGNVGIGTTAPNAKLSVGSGSLNDTNLLVQISTAGAGTRAYYGANKNGGYGVLFGFENQASLGTGGIVRVVSADPLMFVVNNTTEAMRIISNGNVGIGFSTANPTPLGKLHVKGGNVFLEGPTGQGRLGFLPNDATNTDGATQLWRQGSGTTPDNIILRTFTNPSTLLVLLGPPQPATPASFQTREATLTLSREIPDPMTGDAKYSEFLDLYNNYYPTEKQYGIRIQIRNPTGENVAQYHDFVFDQFDGTTHTPLMILKADTKVGIGTNSPTEKLEVAGNVKVSGNLTVTGTKSSIAKLPDGRSVTLYALESPGSWFEDFGEGQLSGGAAFVALDAAFLETVNLEMHYHVFLTPKGECQGLFVPEKGATGFQVRELAGGKSGVSFDYRIVARRRGYEMT